MDVKTLSAISGHVSSATTIDIYSHITDTMRQNAANLIDRGIAHSDTPVDPPKPAPIPKTHAPKFTPYTGKIRKP